MNTGTTPRTYYSRVTKKGQVTIPVAIRRKLKVQPSSVIQFHVDGDTVELKPPLMTLEEAFGSVPALKKPVDFQTVRDEAIEEKVQRTIDEMNR